MLYNNYGPPPGFCFDILCQDSEPMIDDADSPDYNIERKVRNNKLCMTLSSTNRGMLWQIFCSNIAWISDQLIMVDKLIMLAIIHIILQIESFLKFVKEQAESYRSNSVILTMGGDFTYQYAEMYFKNMDKLIRYTHWVMLFHEMKG